ncbi:hypothetical protein [Lachnospira multipara]|uniref:hypothetical protein n=1 Tax=Lachnospira multipara TaxID=28051 RepID=UPI0004842319|nr:hypothetical protein [Lachnospira multipara]
MNIKDYRDKELKSYVIGINLLLVLFNYNYLFEVDFSKENLDVIIQIESVVLPLLEAIAVSSVVGVFVFILDSLYNTRIKEAITLAKFFKKPGMTIFTEIKQGNINDYRINLKKAATKYKNIIENIPTGDAKYNYENSEWYKIYNKHESSEKILVSQRDYLLCRDMCTATVTEAIIIIVGMIMGLVPKAWSIFIVLLIMYILTLIATHNKADRFCKNVIAQDLSKSDD